MNQTTKIVFVSFGLILSIFMASTSALFGYQNLTVFGEDIGARVFGALLALLLSDVALWSWFIVRKQPEQTTIQRSIAIILSTIGFLLSVGFTIGQMTMATALGDYIDRQSVQFIVMVLTVIVVSLNALGLWLYNAKSASDQIQNMMAEAASQALESSLAEAKDLLADKQDVLVKIMAAEFERDVLSRIGFTGDLKRIGTQEVKAEQNGHNDPK